MIRTIGANYKGNSICEFTVWAPLKESIQLQLPERTAIKMEKDNDGYFTATVHQVSPGIRYTYRIDGGAERSDPASFYQPEGVHGPSQVVDLSQFTWTDKGWKGIAPGEMIIYELHIGTFTTQGTFAAAIEKLPRLLEIGINTIELMPISQFPGGCNWGYDGVAHFAPQNTYGGPEELMQLVDACHNLGIAVILDVVYNHFGPEGNYLEEFGPYFNDKYKTPWGKAVNFDGPYSDGVRNYCLANAIHWLQHYHMDGLRLDAIHEMYDSGAVHFWELLTSAVKEEEKKAGRHYFIVAESDLNNPKIVKSTEVGGYGFNAQWLDDFHHALYVLIYPEGQYRYTDFGQIEQLERAYTQGFVHAGDYVHFRKKIFGKSSAGIPGDRFIAFIQNHDQIGNTPDGSRLAARLGRQMIMIAAAMQMLAPYIPLLFMGEEFGATTPFPYFTSHTDLELTESVRKGRIAEFAHENTDNPTPDPADAATYYSAKLNWEEREQPYNQLILNWYRQLILLRRLNKALQNFDRKDIRVYIINSKAFALHRQCGAARHHILALFNLSTEPTMFTLPQLPVVLSTIMTNTWTTDDGADFSAGKQVRLPEQSVRILANS